MKFYKLEKYDFNLSFNAGNKTLNYFLGSSYKKESSFIKENLFERATTKLSLNYNPLNNLKINGSTNLAGAKINIKVGSNGGLGYTIPCPTNISNIQ